MGHAMGGIWPENPAANVMPKISVEMYQEGTIGVPKEAGGGRVPQALGAAVAFFDSGEGLEEIGIASFKKLLMINPETSKWYYTSNVEWQDEYWLFTAHTEEQLEVIKTMHQIPELWEAVFLKLGQVAADWQPAPPAEETNQVRRQLFTALHFQHQEAPENAFVVPMPSTGGVPVDFQVVISYGIWTTDWPHRKPPFYTYAPLLVHVEDNTTSGFQQIDYAYLGKDEAAVSAVTAAYGLLTDRGIQFPPDFSMEPTIEALKRHVRGRMKAVKKADAPPPPTWKSAWD